MIAPRLRSPSNFIFALALVGSGVAGKLEGRLHNSDLSLANNRTHAKVSPIPSSN